MRADVKGLSQKRSLLPVMIARHETVGPGGMGSVRELKRRRMDDPVAGSGSDSDEGAKRIPRRFVGPQASLAQDLIGRPQIGRPQRNVDGQPTNDAIQRPSPVLGPDRMLVQPL